MDSTMQQEVWDRLPLNDYQRNAILQSLMADVLTSQDEMDAEPDETPQHPKKRKREFNEQSETPAHMC